MKVCFSLFVYEDLSFMFSFVFLFFSRDNILYLLHISMDLLNSHKKK